MDANACISRVDVVFERAFRVRGVSRVSLVNAHIFFKVVCGFFGGLNGATGSS